MIALLINDFEVCKNLARVPFPYSIADAEEFLGWVEQAGSRSRFSAICLKTSPDVLRGVISYEWHEGAQNVELGYWLAHALWGQGLMTEAALAMVDHGFVVAGVDEMISGFFTENPASGKVLRRAGFVQVGTAMKMSKAQGVDVPVIDMQLTRQAWHKKKAAPEGAA